MDDAEDDIEQPPWPSHSYKVAGMVSTYALADLEERLGNKPSASAPAWPSFVDWPTKNAHRRENNESWTIEMLQYNDPQPITTANPAPALMPGEQNVTQLPTVAALAIADKSTGVSIVSQSFTLGGNHTRVTRVDLWLHRSSTHAFGFQENSNRFTRLRIVAMVNVKLEPSLRS